MTDTPPPAEPTFEQRIEAAVKAAVDAVAADKQAVIDSLSAEIEALKKLPAEAEGVAVKVKNVLDKYAHDIGGKAYAIFEEIKALV